MSRRGKRRIDDDEVEDDPTSPSRSPAKNAKSMVGGQILHLEVQDFKSYRGRQTIGPFKNFQCVIGPNGAGKSNLMDAISFVLGVQSTHLRGTHLADLIHRSSGRGAAPKKAYVMLVFQKLDTSVVTFKRTISAGSSASSEYRIDNKVVSAGVYVEQLAELGILVKARNFLVFQGDVESIAQKSPKEITALLELISGSDALKEDYDRLSAEVKRCEENTMFNYKKKKGISAERKQVKAQMDEASRFKAKLDEQNETKVTYALWELYHVEKEIEQANEDLDAEEGRRRELDRKQKSAEKALKASKKELAVLNKEKKKLERSLGKRERALEKKRPARIKVKEQISHLKKRIAAAEKEITELESERASHDRDVAELEGLLAEVREAEADFKAELAAEGSTELALAESQVDEYTRLKEEAKTKAMTVTKELESLRRHVQTSTDALAALQSQESELNARRVQLEDQAALLRERRTKVETYIESNIKSKEGLQSELDEVKVTANEAKAAVDKFKAELDEVEAQLQEAKSTSMASERDTKFQESLESMKRLFPGVHGCMTDLCKPVQRRYNVAVTVAMGKNMEAIVVDTTKTAMECIAYLREQRAGTATFIPLDSIKVKPAKDHLRQLGSGVKLVKDLIHNDAAIDRAVTYAVGETLFVETLDEARALCFGRGSGGSGGERYKVVTADGTKINRAGLMTGGVSGIEGKARKWDARALEGLKRKRTKVLRELKSLGKNRSLIARKDQIVESIKGIDKRIQHSEADNRITDDKLRETEEEIAKVTAEIAALEPAIAKEKEAIETAQQKVAKVEKKANKIEDQVFAEFSASVGVKSIREYEEGKLRRQQERVERKLALAKQAAKLQNQLDYLAAHDVDSRAASLEAALAKDADSLAALQSEEEGLVEEMAAAAEALKVVQSDIDAMSLQADDLATTIKEQKKAADDQLKGLGVVSRAVSSLEAKIEQLRGRRHNVFQRCSVEEVDIPLLSGSSLSDVFFGSSGGGGGEGQAASETDALASQATSAVYANEAAIEVDYSGLSRQLKAVVNESEYEAIRAEFEENLKHIAAELERMAPNMKAENQLTDVQGRLEVTEAEFNSARTEAKAAQEAFTEIKHQRYQMFMEAFGHISVVIDEIYKDLTRNESNRIGGTAYLALEDKNEPYLHGVKFNAMPPSKRFREMELLSGGEKTVAALALLFAIHDYRPSPFFVLDEVDAALDNANVKRVASYIRSRSNDFQCIVISLKDTFFENADALVGVYRDVDEGCSRNLTLDLRPYDAPTAAV